MGLSTAETEDGAGALVGSSCFPDSESAYIIAILERVAVAGETGVDILTARKTALSVVPLVTDLRFARLCISWSPL